MMTVAKRVDPALIQKVQARFRRKRFARIEEMIRSLLQDKDRITILDAGGRADYWTLLSDELRPRVQVTILNYGSELEAYDTEDRNGLEIVNALGNACDMPQYPDAYFDFAHSNSVIEHVGGYKNMQSFADEMQRVGRCYYIQTPNFNFPIDPHHAVPFVHWLPDAAKIWIFSNFKVGIGLKSDFSDALQKVDNCRMISPGVFRRLFPNARHYRESFLMAFTKSLIAVGPAHT